MAVPEDADVTRILHAWSQGDSEAAARLMPVVYEELRRCAADNLRREAAITLSKQRR